MTNLNRRNCDSKYHGKHPLLEHTNFSEHAHEVVDLELIAYNKRQKILVKKVQNKRKIDVDEVNVYTT